MGPTENTRVRAQDIISRQIYVYKFNNCKQLELYDY